MAIEIAALAGKFGPAVLSYGPSIIDAAIKLYQGSRNAEPDMLVPASVVGESSEVDPSKLSAAIKDIERSLLTLNGQVTDASLLLTKLAESNAALTEEVRRQRAWILVLSLIVGVSLAFCVVAVIAAFV